MNNEFINDEREAAQAILDIDYDELRKNAIELIINQLGDAMESIEDEVWQFFDHSSAPLVMGEDEDFVEELFNDALKQMIAEKGVNAK